MNHPLEWVKMAKWCELSGDTPNAIHARRKLGKWLDGMECKVVDGNLWVNLAAAERWVASWGQKKAVAA